MKKRFDKQLSEIRMHLEKSSENSAMAQFAYNCFMKWGVDSGARFINRAVRANGAKIRWRHNGIYISSGKNTLILRHCDDVLYISKYFKDFFKEESGSLNTQIIRDFRRPFKQTSKETGDSIWFSSLPERVRTSLGYLAKEPPKLGEIVFDIGAYCGEIAIMFSRLTDVAGRVFAFEPDDTNFDLLERNIAERGLTNVVAIKKGMAGESGTLNFRHSGNMGSQLVDARESGSKAIEVLSLMDACALAKCEPDFVKMDVEGAEVEIIRTALPALAKSKMRFAIASYHIIGGQPTSVLLEEMFRSIGYEVETGYPEHQTTWAWRR